MEILPSYEQATSAPHWLYLVGSYVLATDWRRCALVDKLFYQQFAPRLWLDPLVTARRYGLHPNDGEFLAYWIARFINIHLSYVRSETRELVRSLDFRDFAIVASGLYSTDASERAISDSFKRLPALFPSLSCLLIGGHPELNPESLTWVNPNDANKQPWSSLELLDLANCPHPLTTRFFRSTYLKDLVYLDISSLPGSVGYIVQASLNPDHVPGLRVLKLRQRELDDSTTQLLLEKFGRQLWSLDLSYNKLTDATIDTLIRTSFSSLSFRSAAHFDVEGKLVSPQQAGTTGYGLLEFVVESEKSSTFTHPMRYLPDAPPYMRRGEQETQEWQTVRHTGGEPRRHDNVDHMRNHLLEQGTVSFNDSSHNYRGGRGGITHLSLNGNKFTREGVQRLLNCSLGRLEHFECSNPRIPSLTSNPYSSLDVSGLIGCSHLIRPVFSSNLRSLRAHHSIVTNIPKVSGETLSAEAAAVFAETVLRERVQMAYPQVLVPDTNPRLSSLTLTGIPSRSVGPLISALTGFLDFASNQQRAVEETTLLNTRHRTKIMRGLQHIRLELSPTQPVELSVGVSNDNVDFDELLDPARLIVDGQHSDGDKLDISRSTHSKDHISAIRSTSQHTGDTKSGASPDDPDTAAISQTDIWHSPEQEHIIYRVKAADSWSGNVFSLRVWIGSGIAGPHPAVNEYMINLQDQRLRTNVGPAMPHHVIAGVPSGSYIFYGAWNEMIFPKSKIQRSLVPSKDVPTAIKLYRAKTKGTNRHWNGKLELVRG